MEYTFYEYIIILYEKINIKLKNYYFNLRYYGHF